MAWFSSQQKEILDGVRQLLLDYTSTKKSLEVVRLDLQGFSSKLYSIEGTVAENRQQLLDLQVALAQINAKLTQLLPGPAARFTATVSVSSGSVLSSSPNSQGEQSMPTPTKASADLQVNEVTGIVTVNLSFMDADDAPVPAPAGLSATYAPSDAILSLSPSADGASASGGVDQAAAKALNDAGTALPTGLTVSVTATWDGLAAPLTVVAAPPVDIVPGAASSFVAVASAV